MDAFGDPVQEILDRGLSHSVHERSIHGRPDHAERGFVAYVDGQQAATFSQPRDLEIGVKPRKQPRVRVIDPGDGNEGCSRKLGRLSQIDVDTSLDAMAAQFQPDIGGKSRSYPNAVLHKVGQPLIRLS